MKNRVNKRITLLLTGAACVLFCTETASASFYTFWKTGQCPTFGGAKTVAAQEVGIMQSIVDGKNAETGFPGAGGVFCVLDSSTSATRLVPVEEKKFLTTTAAVVNSLSVDAEGWRCVVCQYKEKMIGIPAASTLGMAILFVGLMTAAIYRIRQKQLKVTT